MHYPGKFDNDGKQNDEIHKDKAVLNHPAGNIEFVNTKDCESVTITHKSGSHLKMDKNGVDELVTRDKREHVIGDSLEAVNGRKTVMIDENEETIILGDHHHTVGDADKWAEPMNKIKAAQKELHDKKRLFEVKRTDRKNPMDQAPNQSKSGSHAKCPSHSNKSKIIKTSSPPKKKNEKKGSREVLEIEDGKDEFKSVSGSGNNLCMTCWGKTLSPSTQDGKFATESEKQKISSDRERIQKQIFEHEKQLGQSKCPNGGTSVEVIAKNFIQNIGLVMNDFESFRKDPSGKLVPCGVKIDPLGTTIYTQYRDASLIEHVDVEKFPGGSYHLNVCDGWTATVGSNGIDFKTSGPLHLYGPIVNIHGEDVNIGSRGELALDGERVDIAGDIITLSPKKGKRTLETGGQTEDEQQVLVDGNLNVGINMIVRGGAHIEGEVSLHHITAPCEYHITESDFTYGKQQEPMKKISPEGLCHYGENGVKTTETPQEDTDTVERSPTYATLLEGAHIGKAVGYDNDGKKLCLEVYSLKSENFAVVDQHFHYFKSLPLKLLEKDSQVQASVGQQQGSGSANAHDAVRAVGARNNFPKPVLAKPVKNSKTEHTVVTKFGGNGTKPLSINKTDWEESSEDDSLPSGEGARTSNYKDETVKQKIKQLEAELEAKYTELKQALAKLEREQC